MTQAPYVRDMPEGHRSGRFRCVAGTGEGCGPWYLVLPEARETMPEAIMRQVKAHEATHAR